MFIYTLGSCNKLFPPWSYFFSFNPNKHSSSSEHSFDLQPISFSIDSSRKKSEHSICPGSFPSICFIFLDGKVTVKKCRSGSNNAGLGSDNAGPGSDNAGPEAIMQVPEEKMQVLGSNNAGPWKWWCRSRSDILWPELMSEGIETLIEKKKANGIMLGSNFICQKFSFLSGPSLWVHLREGLKKKVETSTREGGGGC